MLLAQHTEPFCFQSRQETRRPGFWAMSHLWWDPVHRRGGLPSISCARAPALSRLPGVGTCSGCARGPFPDKTLSVGCTPWHLPSPATPLPPARLCSPRPCALPVTRVPSGLSVLAACGPQSSGLPACLLCSSPGSVPLPAVYAACPLTPQLLSRGSVGHGLHCSSPLKLTGFCTSTELHVHHNRQF